MKLSSPLFIRELRTLFGFIRGLIILGIVLSPIPLFVDHFSDYRPSRTDFGPIEFSPDISAFRAGFTTPGLPAEGIKLVSLTGTLAVTEQRYDGATLRNATLVPVYAAKLASYLTLVAIAHLLWLLCRAVESGEMFSKRNSQLVHWLGLALVARCCVQLVFQTWQRASIAQHLATHIQFEGLRPILTANDLSWWEHAFASAARYGDFDFTLFITGLLVLALAEVFRRGLALKEESDLTV